MDIDELDIENLTEDTKQDALNQMQAMISNMQKLMQKLEGTSAVQ